MIACIDSILSCYLRNESILSRNGIFKVCQLLTEDSLFKWDVKWKKIINKKKYTNPIMQNCKIGVSSNSFTLFALFTFPYFLEVVNHLCEMCRNVSERLWFDWEFIWSMNEGNNFLLPHHLVSSSLLRLITHHMMLVRSFRVSTRPWT